MPSEPSPPCTVPPGSPRGNDPPSVKDTHDHEPPRELANDPARRAGCSGHPESHRLRLGPDQRRRRLAEPSPAAAPMRPASPAQRASSPLRARAPRPTPSTKSSPTTTPNVATRPRSSTTRPVQVPASSRSTTASSTSPAPTPRSRPRQLTASSRPTRPRNAARTTRPGTCRWWSARSPSPTTSTASTSSC